MKWMMKEAVEVTNLQVEKTPHPINLSKDREGVILASLEASV